jgi:hypothetical protein
MRLFYVNFTNSFPSSASENPLGSRIRKNAGCRLPTRILAIAATGYFLLRLPEL